MPKTAAASLEAKGPNRGYVGIVENKMESLGPFKGIHRGGPFGVV